MDNETQTQNVQTETPPATADLNEGTLIGEATAPQENQNPQATETQQAETQPEAQTETVDPMDTIPTENYSFSDAEGQNIVPEQSFQDAFKDAKLTSRQGQKMYEAYTKAQSEWVEELKAKALEERHDNMAKIQADPELGGQNFNLTKMRIGVVMDRYATPELRQYLNASGLGSNPELVKAFVRIGKDLCSDSFVAGKGHAHEESAFERAKRMYPKSPELWK